MEKYFTVEEANRALVLVQPVVADVLMKLGKAQRHRAEIKEERANPSASEKILLEKITAAEKLLNEVEYHMKELASIGVLLKDVKTGLVDFPSTRDGNIVYLCWMPGEKEVQAWHGVREGFAQRRPLALESVAH